MDLKIDSRLKTRFPELLVLTCHVKGVMVEKRNVELEKFKYELMEHVRKRYDLESLKNMPTFRVYRDFFWGLG